VSVPSLLNEGDVIKVDTRYREATSSGCEGNPMNLKEIREILELMKGSDVSEFELGRVGHRAQAPQGAGERSRSPSSGGAARARGPAPPGGGPPAAASVPRSRPTRDRLPDRGDLLPLPGSRRRSFVEVGPRGQGAGCCASSRR